MNDTVRFVAFGVNAQGIWIVFTFQFNNLTAVVTDNLTAGHDVSATQTHRLIRSKTLPFTGRFFREVFPVDVQGLAPGHFTLAHVRVLGVNRQHQGFGLVFRVVGQCHLQRTHYAHGARRTGVQVFANGVLEHSHIHGTAGLVDTYHVAEGADGLRGITTTAHAGDGGHAWVIPAIHKAFIHQTLEFALAGDGVIEVQPGKFDLPWLAGSGDVVQHPVIQRAMILEFQGAQGMGNPLHGVGNRVGEVVHRIDAPFIASLVMVGVANPVQNRVPQIDVRGGHIDFGAQHQLTVLILTGAHIAEQLKVFFYRTVTIGAVLARLFKRAAVLGHLIGSQRAHIGFALFNQLNGEVVNGVKIVRSVANLSAPFTTQPMNILLDGVNVLLGFLFRISIIKPQRAFAVKGFRNAEIQANGFGVADVQITVRLGRKTGHNLTRVFAFGNGVFDQALDEVMGFLGLGAHTISIVGCVSETAYYTHKSLPNSCTRTNSSVQ